MVIKNKYYRHSGIPEKKFLQIIRYVDGSYFGPKCIRGKVDLGSVVHSDGRHCYHGLVGSGYAKHNRALHRDSPFARKNVHIKAINVSGLKRKSD